MLAKQRLHIRNEFCTQLVCLHGINFKWSGMVMPFQCYIYSLRLPGELWHPSWNPSLQHSLFITLLFSNTVICKLNALSSITCGNHVIPIDCICCPVDKCGKCFVLELTQRAPLWQRMLPALCLQEHDRLKLACSEEWKMSWQIARLNMSSVWWHSLIAWLSQLSTHLVVFAVRFPEEPHGSTCKTGIMLAPAYYKSICRKPQTSRAMLPKRQGEHSLGGLEMFSQAEMPSDWVYRLNQLPILFLKDREGGYISFDREHVYNLS